MIDRLKAWRDEPEGANAATQQSGDESAEAAVAYLENGPERYYGIDFFSPDITAYWRGVYDLPFHGATVVVYYVDGVLAKAQAWRVLQCGTGRMLRVDPDGKRYYFEATSWSAVVMLSARIGEPSARPEETAMPWSDSLPCLFLDEFASKHYDFQRIEGDRTNTARTPPAFPAVLELE